MAPDAPESTRRAASIARDTKETKIVVILDVDGGELDLPAAAKVTGERKNKHAFQSSKTQYVDIDTGVGFLDHMIHALAKHAGWSLYVRTAGDLHSKHARAGQNREHIGIKRVE